MVTDLRLDHFHSLSPQLVEDTLYADSWVVSHVLKHYIDSNVGPCATNPGTSRRRASTYLGVKTHPLAHRSHSPAVDHKWSMLLSHFRANHLYKVQHVIRHSRHPKVRPIGEVVLVHLAYDSRGDLQGNPHQHNTNTRELTSLTLDRVNWRRV